MDGSWHMAMFRRARTRLHRRACLASSRRCVRPLQSSRCSVKPAGGQISQGSSRLSRVMRDRASVELFPELPAQTGARGCRSAAAEDCCRK
jgi:hypothetical protein